MLDTNYQSVRGSLWSAYDESGPGGWLAGGGQWGAGGRGRLARTDRSDGRRAHQCRHERKKLDCLGATAALVNIEPMTVFVVVRPVAHLELENRVVALQELQTKDRVSLASSLHGLPACPAHNRIVMLYR